MHLVGTWRVEVTDSQLFQGVLFSFEMVIVAGCQKQGPRQVSFPPLIWPLDKSSQLKVKDASWEPLLPQFSQDDCDMLGTLPQDQVHSVLLSNEDVLDLDLDWSIKEPNTYLLTAKNGSPMSGLAPRTVEVLVLTRHGPYFLYDFVASITITTCASAIEIDSNKAPIEVADSGYETIFKGSEDSTIDETTIRLRFELKSKLGAEFDWIAQRCE